MPHSEPLSVLDELFLHVEGPTTHMHVGAVATFEGPAPRLEEVLTLVSSRLERIPRARQRVAAGPLGLARAVWVDDPSFDIRRHVLGTKVPSPGDGPALERLTATIMARPLLRSRPLWELWVADGLEDGGWALVSKTHHAVADGVSGVEAMAGLLDPRPEAGPRPQAPSGHADWRARPSPTREELLGEALSRSVARSARSVRAALRASLSAPETLAARLRSGTAAVAEFVGSALSAPPSTLNRPVGERRRFVTTVADLAELDRIRSGAGATINDVVLAAVTGGLRRLLQSRGEATDELELRAMVPVSTRTAPRAPGAGNQVAAVWATLPVYEEDASVRLGLIAAHTRALKASGQVSGAQTLAALSEHVPSALLGVAARLAGRQRACNLAISNVAGPTVPLYFGGRRMLVVYPVLPLMANTTVSVAVLSYSGRLGFGVLADEATGDLGVLVEGIEKSIAEMAASC
jgi:diacylglycerol O-acyltransferase